MPRDSFRRFGGACAILAGITGLLYAVSFVLVARADPELGALLSAGFLLIGGLLSTVVFAAVYDALRDENPGFARAALVLGVAGALGAAIHGAYDLANAVHPPDADLLAEVNLPNQVDPRGFLTFAVTGLAILTLSWVASRSGRWGGGLVLLGYLAGGLLIVVYLSRLLVLDPTSPLLLGPAALAGFLVNPAWLIWLGVTLRRSDRGGPASV